MASIHHPQQTLLGANNPGLGWCRSPQEFKAAGLLRSVSYTHLRAHETS